ncbi:GNAT family N-acetyltransferase [Lacibacterium aquatile]|uniref:GNAT family N-acetyltransferase n=1 Tax=Lacibacterium aquatile TaxID=1168082 RepID=A0ABW5DY58_9PROT
MDQAGFVVTDAPSDADVAALRDVLVRHNIEVSGRPETEPFAIFIPDETGAISGGLWGHSRCGSFFISLLIVPKAMRGQGTGRRLMAMAEDEARRRNCDHIWLDTFAFQGRDFYLKCGFEIFGTLEGQAPIHPRYFMRKLLSGGAAT